MPAIALKEAICLKTSLTKRGRGRKKRRKNKKKNVLDGDHFHDGALSVVGAQSHGDLKCLRTKGSRAVKYSPLEEQLQVVLICTK